MKNQERIITEFVCSTTYKITRLIDRKDKFDRSYQIEQFEVLTTDDIQRDLKILKWNIKSIEIGL